MRDWAKLLRQRRSYDPRHGEENFGKREQKANRVQVRCWVCFAHFALKQVQGLLDRFGTDVASVEIHELNLAISEGENLFH